MKNKKIKLKNLSKITKAVDNTTQEVKEFTGTIPKGSDSSKKEYEKWLLENDNKGIDL